MQLQTFIKVVLAIALLGFIGLAVNQIKNDREVKQIQKIEIKSNEAKLIELDNKYNEVLELKSNTEAEKQEQQKKIDELESERQRLERELQAKLNRQAEEKKKLAEASKKATGTQTVSASPVSGSKYDWMIQAGIPESEWQYVDYIVSKESSWKPCAYYPSKNDCGASPKTACGLAMSLPCGKQSKFGHWTDPVANLKWQAEYVKGRYGGYRQAYAFWVVNKWY